MNRTEAMAVLGISAASEAKAAMRNLVQIHHPDKGGTQKRFVQIMDAYRCLTGSYKVDIPRLQFGFPDVRESVFQGKVIKSLRAGGCLVWKMHGHGMQKIGIPDLYFAGPLTGWLELKVGNNQVSAIQALTLKQLRDVKVWAYVARLSRGAVSLEDEAGEVFTVVRDWVGPGFVESLMLAG
jgi:hypothetical protein